LPGHICSRLGYKLCILSIPSRIRPKESDSSYTEYFPSIPSSSYMSTLHLLHEQGTRENLSLLRGDPCHVCGPMDAGLISPRTLRSRVLAGFRVLLRQLEFL
jgi:hypothetical protein